MKKIIIFFSIISLTLPVVVMAQSTSTDSTVKPKMVNKDVKVNHLNIEKKNAIENRIISAKEKDIKAIDERIQNLNKLLSRIDEMKKISAEQKVAIRKTVENVIISLQSLKSRIQNESDISVLKNESKTIGQAYRVYALVMPQIEIIAAGDRVKNVADMILATVDKLETRINQNSMTNSDTTKQVIEDIRKNVADAVKNADQAISIVSALVPDQGNRTIMESNNTALKEARAKIQTAKKTVNEAKKLLDKQVASLTKSEKKSVRK